MLRTKRFILQRSLLLVSTILFATVSASNDHVIRIGTGGSSGTYHVIGSLIAEVLNGQNEGALGDVLVVPQRSQGSVSNVQEIKDKLLESALVQADIMHRAFYGADSYKEQGPSPDLRAIGSLYLESLHLVVSIDSGIQSVNDLAGARVSVDEVGSGTQIGVDALLESFGLSNSNVKLVYLKPIDAIERMRSGQLDAFFMVAGYPISAITELVQEGRAMIVPVSGDSIDAFLQQYPFFSADEIPANTYGNQSKIATIGVAAQWAVTAGIDPSLVYDMTKILWSDSSLARLSQGHPKGKEVTLDSALVGISIPLHPGAEKYFREKGLEIPNPQ